MKTMWTWRTTPEGFVEVDKLGDGNFERITLGHADSATTRTETWIPLAKKYADAEGLPVPWVLAVIYSESGGNPSIASSDSVGAGLMQITVDPPIFGLSRAQALDPEANVKAGTHYLGTYAKKGNDLVQVASIFNAGPGTDGHPHPDVSKPFGLREHVPSIPFSGYIEKVVAASNYWTDRLPGILPGYGTGPSSTAASFGAGLLVAAGGAVATYYALKAWLGF